MQKPKFININISVLLVLILVFISSCTTAETTPIVEESPSPTETQINAIPEEPAEPTPTPEPAAAVVNGESIPLAFFTREVERYLIAQVALGNEEVDQTAAQEIVLHDLIDQFLLAQGARKSGAQVSDEDVQTRIANLAAEVDLEAWMAEWGYTNDELREALKLQMLVAFQRDAITAAIPEVVEQVELRQVFRFTEAGANSALLRINSGESFEDVAFESSPETGGYLGWVPRGYLLIAEVEEAVFDTPVGAYTEIVESEIGFHIVLVIDRDERALSTDARLVLERQTLQTWLENQREESTIEILVE